MEVCIQLSAILVDELFDLHNLRKWVKNKTKTEQYSVYCHRGEKKIENIHT